MAVGLICGFAGLSARPAQAGQWNIIYGNDAQPGSNIDLSDGFKFSKDFGDPGTFNANVSVTPTLTWAPNGANDPPPSKVHLLVTATASVDSECHDLDDVDTSPITVSNGLGGDCNDYYNWGRHKTQSLKKLFTIDNGGHNASVSLQQPIQLSGSATIPDDVQSDGRNYFHFSCKAIIDPRSVTLTRGVAALRENDPDLIKSRDEWIESDGTGHGHSRFSYYERVLTTEMGGAGTLGSTNSYRDDPIDVVESIGANRSGWPTDLSKLSGNWQVNPLSDYYVATLNGMTFTTVQGNSLNDPSGFEAVLNNPLSSLKPGWYRVPSQGSKDISATYDLTDATDGAKATAKYYLTLHDEWENPSDDDRIFPPNAPAETGVSYEEQYFVPQGAFSATRDTDATWSITQTDDFIVQLKMFFEANFGLKDWGKVGGNMETTKTISRQSINGTQAGKPSDIYPNHTDSARYLSVVVYQAKRLHKLVDHFGTSGFLPSAATVGPVIQRSDPRWGKTPQSKIDSLNDARADWWPYSLGQSYPQEGTTDTWHKSGSVS